MCSSLHYYSILLMWLTALVVMTEAEITTALLHDEHSDDVYSSVLHPVLLFISMALSSSVSFGGREKVVKNTKMKTGDVRNSKRNPRICMLTLTLSSFPSRFER